MEEKIDYILEVGCYRGGLRRDGGRQKIEAADDRDAKTKAQQEVSWLLRHYDHVDWELKQGDRKVC